MARDRATPIQTPGESPAAPPETATEPVAAPAAAEPAAGLRAADVDPYKIKRSVLTLDGWVCPATSPAPPARQ